MEQRTIPIHRSVAVVLVTAALAVFAVACGPSGDAGTSIASPDERDAVAIPKGKADAPWSTCQREQVLLWLNDPGTALADLKGAGVHTRGARNLIEHRNGSDGQYGTEDDDPFGTLREVDDVYWVGPVAMEQLTSAVADSCEDAPERSAEVLFSPKPYDQSHLPEVVDLIESADTSIDIAMYSFHSRDVLQALADAHDRGVAIRMIYNKTEQERDEGDDTTSAKLERRGVNVRWVNRTMHHKFMIVDGPKTSLREASTATLMTGSGNWSYGAASIYDENTVTLEGDAEIVLRFQDEFNLMWEYSREYVKNDSLSYQQSLQFDREMIPDREGVDASFTSDNFRTYISSRWGPTFGIKRGVSTVSKRIVRRIEEADESIWIASGHLRSRPISEALIEKHRDDPEVEIRVYVDGQEFISEGYHHYQKQELQECLEEAGDSQAQREDCLNKGFYFSYKVHDAGIPIRFKFYAYRWHYTYAEQMHHKYVIFDGETVFSGSYNFSDNAEHNTLENLVVYRSSDYPHLVDRFEQNFQSIWKTGRADEGLTALKETIRQATDEIPIVFDPLALDYGEVTELENLIEQTCPAVESEDYDDDPENHETCEL